MQSLPRLVLVFSTLTVCEALISRHHDSGHSTFPEDTFRSACVDGKDTSTKVKQPKFVYKHLTKAGGTYGEWLLRKVVKTSNLAIVSDDAALCTHQKRHFLAIGMRNPCDTYVSFANFHAGKAFYGRETMGSWDQARWLQDHNGKGYRISGTELEKWLLDARGVDSTGYYSWYMWQQLIAPECANWQGEQKRDPAKVASASRCVNSTRFMEDWHAYSPKKEASCWIFQESMLDDFRGCLKAYEESSVFAHGAIDWDMFERIAKGDEQFADHGKRQGGHLHSLERSTERHMSCAEYSSSIKLEDIVRRSDPELFEKFGYTSCCQPSTHQLQ